MQQHMKFTPPRQNITYMTCSRKNASQTSNRLKELTDAYATLYGNKEPVGLDTDNSKINDGWREENITGSPEQLDKKTSNMQVYKTKKNMKWKLGTGAYCVKMIWLDMQEVG